MCVQNWKFVALPVSEIKEATEKFSAVSGYVHHPFSPKFLSGFCSHGRFKNWIHLLNLKFVSLPVPEIIGGTQKIWAILAGYAHAPFSPKFVHGLVFGWTLWMYRPNLQSVALAVPEIIAIAVLGLGCEPPILGMGGRRGSGMVPFERTFVTSYRRSTVTFPLSLRVSEILPLFHTPPLVSPKSPHVPLKVNGLQKRMC